MKQIINCLIVIVLLLLIYRLSIAERLRNPDYLGGGLGAAVYTSGATLRRLGQKFTSTDQGEYTTIHNAEIKDQALREASAIPVVIYPAKFIPSQITTNATAANYQ